jgi:hypothetical protein
VPFSIPAAHRRFAQPLNPDFLLFFFPRTAQQFPFHSWKDFALLSTSTAQN